MNTSSSGPMYPICPVFSALVKITPKYSSNQVSRSRNLMYT